MFFNNILVPIDFSEASRAALRLAVKIARASKDSRITLLHIGVSPAMTWSDMTHYGVAVPESLVKLHEQMAQEQEHMLRKLGNEEIPEDVLWACSLREGFPPEEVVAEVEAGKNDLIVMGTHGRTGLSRVLLGSVAERVLRDSKVPVLVTR
jgi:nucleotide-binding universal stress UspA family protein